MPRYFKNLLFIPLILIGLIFSNCSKDSVNIKKPEKILPLAILYKNAFQLYEEGRWDESIENFKKVETHYSFSEWAPRATLMIIYIYYESSFYVKSLEYIKKFKKLYPKHINMNYVEFISALIFYEQISSSSKDMTYAIEALKQFKKVIKNYPDTIYANESIFKIDLINEILAGKQMYIARFYMKKSKWISAIKRLQIVINDYDKTIYSEEALHRLVEIYYRLGNLNEAKKYGAILGYNFNDGNWYKKTYKIVADRNYKLDDKKTKKKLRDRVKEIFKFSK